MTEPTKREGRLVAGDETHAVEQGAERPRQPVEGRREIMEKAEDRSGTLVAGEETHEIEQSPARGTADRGAGKPEPK